MKMSTTDDITYVRETFIRKPEIIEKELMFADSEFAVFEEPPLDLIGIDAEGVICLAVLRDEMQGERRREGGGNVVEDAAFYWHWVTDWRQDFIDGISQLAERPAILAPPRIMIFAPSFSGKLMDLASYVNTRISLELYEFDPSEVSRGVNRIQISKLSATVAARNKYDSYHGDKMSELQIENKSFFENPKFRAYMPATVAQIGETVDNELKSKYDQLVARFQNLQELRTQPRSNRLTFVHASGYKVCEIVVGPGGGYMCTTFNRDHSAENGITRRNQFGPDAEEEGIMDAKKALEDF